MVAVGELFQEQTTLQGRGPMLGWHPDKPLIFPGLGHWQQPEAQWSASPEILNSEYLGTWGRLSNRQGAKIKSTLLLYVSVCVGGEGFFFFFCFF